MRLTILALALASASAHATAPHEPAPSPAPVAAPAMPAEAHSTSTSSASAGAAAGAVSGSTSTGGTSSATGGTSSATGGQATTGSSTSATANTTNSRALGLGFPSINFGSASTSECIVGGPSGGAVGWNFAAKTAPSAVEAPVCSLRALAREAAAQCQWRTAALLRAEAARRVGIEPPPVADALRDVDPVNCMQQPAPIVVPAPAVQPVTVLVSTEVEQAAPVVAPRRPPKGKPATCPPGQRVVQVCEAPK